MTVARSAPSSRSWHERDDAAERNFLICDHLWVNAMPVEQLAMARRLARERCALAEVPSLGRVVRTREARSEQSIAFQSQENYSKGPSPNGMYVSCGVRCGTVVVESCAA